MPDMAQKVLEKNTALSTLGKRVLPASMEMFALKYMPMLVLRGYSAL